MDKKVLLGVDGSKNSINAVSTVGELFKGKEDLEITIFHGTPGLKDLRFPLPGLASLISEEKYGEVCEKEARGILESAFGILKDAGFDPKKISTVWQRECSNPAKSMLELSLEGGMDTIMLARSRESSGEDPPPMGSLAQDLLLTADKRTIWVIDGPAPSRDVLVALVGAHASKRVVDYVVRYLSHLKGSRFTFFHVVPPLPPAYWDDGHILDDAEYAERVRKIAREYAAQVKENSERGRAMLVEKGVPGENVSMEVSAVKAGIARDILKELDTGRYGILVIGRKGSKEISQFPLGSKAAKLTHRAQGRIVCVVN